jgi:hypothetical protein
MKYPIIGIAAACVAILGAPYVYAVCDLIQWR